MATGAQAIEATSRVTGIPLASVERTARALKEAEGGLWPKARPGGGKNSAHIEARHLANLTLALLGTDTLAAAPEAVRQLRELKPDSLDERTRLTDGYYDAREMSVRSRLYSSKNVLWQYARSRDRDNSFADTMRDGWLGRTLGETIERLIIFCAFPEGRKLIRDLFEELVVYRDEPFGAITMRIPSEETAERKETVK